MLGVSSEAIFRDGPLQGTPRHSRVRLNSLAFYKGRGAVLPVF